MNVAGAEIRQRAPVVYQECRGGRQRVTGRYEARSKTSVGFRIGAFDARRPLVIDPTLAYSTYLGGTSTEDPGGIAVDGAGNMYVSGTTQSVDFPTVLAPQPSLASPAYTDMFVVKLNAAGSALLYSTYIGG